MSCSCCSHDSKESIFEPFIDRFALSERCPLDTGRTKRFIRPQICTPMHEWNRSKLQSLPIELYQACLSYLDLATLTGMRRVSQYTRRAIDSLYWYQELHEHAPQALRACLSTGVAPHIPLRRLHHALTTLECYYCTISSVLPLTSQSPTNCGATATIPNLLSALTSPSTKADELASSASATTPFSSPSSSWPS